MHIFFFEITIKDSNGKRFVIRAALNERVRTLSSKREEAMLCSSLFNKVVRPNMSCLEPHADFFRLLMKGIFDPYLP
jgi:hypothetical protein